MARGTPQDPADLGDPAAVKLFTEDALLQRRADALALIERNGPFALQKYRGRLLQYLWHFAPEQDAGRGGHDRAMRAAIFCELARQLRHLDEDFSRQVAESQARATPADA